MKLPTAPLLVVAAMTGACASRPGALPDAAAVIVPPAVVIPASAPASAVMAERLGSTELAADETRVGRYTTVSARPAEADANPLAVIAQVHFPRGVVVTVGDAVRYVLLRTGYRLVAPETLDERVKTVFSLPLPDHQRVLGPYRVDAMLGALVQPFRLVADPAARTVSYAAPAARASTADAAPGATAATAPLPAPGSAASAGSAVRAAKAASDPA
jgi:type IV pili sensor histidine kinase/response regulator